MSIRKTQMNFSRWPGQPLPDDQVIRLIHDAGPEWAKRDVAVEALATFIAESRLHPRAYLARVRLPKGAYFLVEKDADGNDVTVYRSPRYQAIRDKSGDWPASLSLATARRRFRLMGCKVVSSDRGIVQSNESFDPVSDKVAFSLDHNIAKGYQIFVNRDCTFNAWYANVNGHHVKNLPRARKAWDHVYG